MKKHSKYCLPVVLSTFAQLSCFTWPPGPTNERNLTLLPNNIQPKIRPRLTSTNKFAQEAVKVRFFFVLFWMHDSSILPFLSLFVCPPGFLDDLDLSLLSETGQQKLGPAWCAFGGWQPMFNLPFYLLPLLTCTFFTCPPATLPTNDGIRVVQPNKEI